MMLLVGSAIGPFAIPSRGGAVIPAGNQYISIEKVVTPTTLKNEDLPSKASYIIRVRPRKGELTFVEIKDSVVASSRSGTKTLAEKTWSEASIAGEKTFEYSIDLDHDLSDSVVSNTVTISFTVLGQPARQNDSVNQALRIGNPPEECPSGWPTDYGKITQGANSGFTHKGYEAIDIGNTSGKRIAGATIRASHRGRVSTNCGSSLYGTCATITTTCEGKQVTTLYAHMLSRSVNDGQEVMRGAEVGKVGATGNVYGFDPNHLHYEFRNNVLKIVPPYIPVFPAVGVSW
ncbi:MAG: M23 family metallopeptidase [Candidatus Blackburnbacteria bacterium]|nr:M23 family metallopeptidase [Candidatus Blackburnbacteria bacterium]